MFRISMKLLVFATLSLSVFPLTPAPAAPAQSAEALESADVLIVRSGVARQLRAYEKQVQEELSQSGGDLPQDVVNALRDAARVGFSAEEMQRNMTRHVSANLALADMKQALVWLDSEVGRRVTAAEEEASESVTPETLQAFLAGLQTQPPSALRLELIAGLIEATRSVEHAAHSLESIALGVAVGLNATQPAQNRVGMEELRARLKLVMPPEQLREQMGAVLPAYFGYTYRAVSDDELARYLDFNRSEIGRRYNDALMAAFIDAVTRASVSMGPLIEQGLRRQST